MSRFDPFGCESPHWAWFFARQRPLVRQSTFTSQLTGLTLTEEGTDVPTLHLPDARGIYVFTGLRPSTYTIFAWRRPDRANYYFGDEQRGITIAASYGFGPAAERSRPT